jgi:glycosyltransferase involved in cell wall biosynthesis
LSSTTQHKSDSSATQTPTIAWISNSLPPYRLFSFRRLIREIPEIELWSLFTHGPGKSTANLPWKQDYPADIRPVLFHSGEPLARRLNVRTAVSEWNKGGRMIRWLKEHYAQAVIVGGYNDFGRLRVIRWCGRQRIPCFLVADSNIYGDRTRGWKAVLKSRLLKEILQNCTAVLVCGSAGAEYFRKYGLDKARIYIAPYESDFELFKNRDSEKIRQVQQQFGLTPDRRRLVYSGRFVPVKRVDLLIDAFITLAAQRPDWDLVLVGDGPLRESLKARVPSELQSRVQWLGFVEQPEVLASIYHLCDVLVLPSDDEPWGIVVTEAAAAGLAIVASDVVGAAHELVRPGVNGELFPVGDGNRLFNVLSAVTDPDKIDRMREASTQVFQQWRESSDPLPALRRALESANVLGKNLPHPTPVGT